MGATRFTDPSRYFIPGLNEGERRENGLIFNVNIFRALTTYQFTDRLLFRSITEYDTYDQTLGLNFLVTYRVKLITREPSSTSGMTTTTGNAHNSMTRSTSPGRGINRPTVPVSTDQPRDLYQVPVSVQVRRGVDVQFSLQGFPDLGRWRPSP